jgi:mycofactocin precursor
VNLKRIEINSKSPERVIGFPPFGGLFLMTISSIISPSEKQQQGKQFNQFNQFETGKKIMNDKDTDYKEELLQEATEEQNRKINSDIYTTREIEIEEVAIDGICGVY